MSSQIVTRESWFVFFQYDAQKTSQIFGPSPSSGPLFTFSPLPVFFFFS